MWLSGHKLTFLILLVEEVHLYSTFITSLGFNLLQHCVSTMQWPLAIDFFLNNVKFCFMYLCISISYHTQHVLIPCSSGILSHKHKGSTYLQYEAVCIGFRWLEQIKLRDILSKARKRQECWKSPRRPGQDASGAW